MSRREQAEQAQPDLGGRTLRRSPCRSLEIVEIRLNRVGKQFLGR
jgi:hypothetical protein